MSFHSRTPVKAHQPVHDSTLTKAINWGQPLRLAGTRDINHNGICQTPAAWPYTYTCTHSRPRPHTGEHGLLFLPPRVPTTPAWGNSYQDDAPPSQSKPAAFFCVTIYLLSFSNVPPTPPSAILSPSLRSPAPSRPFPSSPIRRLLASSASFARRTSSRFPRACGSALGPTDAYAGSCTLADPCPTTSLRSGHAVPGPTPRVRQAIDLRASFATP